MVAVSPYQHAVASTIIKNSGMVFSIGFIALEAGWIVTEVGRQPWIIQGVMKTKDAVTPVPNMAVYFYIFSTIYLILGLTVVWLMRRQFKQLS